MSEHEKALRRISTMTNPADMRRIAREALGDPVEYRVYELRDARNVPFYVGQTVQALSARLAQHRTQGGRRVRDRAYSIHELEVVASHDSALERELYWYQRYIAEGVVLQQRHPGAGVGLNLTLPEDVQARIDSEASNGATCAEIARRLNADGVPTVSGGSSQWHSNTVSKAVSGAWRP